MKYISLLVFPLALLLLVGCAGKSTDQSMADSPEAIVQKAMEAYSSGRYITALKHFEVLTDRFPFSQYSLMAELKSADCHYYERHYTEAIAAYHRHRFGGPRAKARGEAPHSITTSYHRARCPGASSKRALPLLRTQDMEARRRPLPSSGYTVTRSGRTGSRTVAQSLPT